MEPDNVSTIQRYPAPTNKMDLRRVNGILNQRAESSKPGIHQRANANGGATKENGQWIWNAHQNVAFVRLKIILVSADTMAHYDPSPETVVTTDASQHGLGATFFQIQKDGSGKPICFVRPLTETDAVIGKEALVIAWACDRFDQFLRGMSFTLETNHKPLVRLMNTKRVK